MSLMVLEKLVLGTYALSMFWEKMPDLFETHFICFCITRVTFKVIQCIVTISPEFPFPK